MNRPGFPIGTRVVPSSPVDRGRFGMGTVISDKEWDRLTPTPCPITCVPVLFDDGYHFGYFPENLSIVTPMEKVPAIGSRVRITDDVPNLMWAGAIVEIIERPGMYQGEWPCYGRLVSQTPRRGPTAKVGQVTCLELYYLESMDPPTPEEVESAIAGIDAILATE